MLGVEDKRRNGLFFALSGDGDLCTVGQNLGKTIGNNRWIQKRRYYRETPKASDIVEVHLDLDLGHLSFSVNGKYLGVAFDSSCIDCDGTYGLKVWMQRFDTEIVIGSSHRILCEWKQ